MGRRDEFVDDIVKLCKSDNGIRAAFRHAENEKMEPRVWPYIYNFVDLDDARLRRAYVLVAWAIAKSDDDVVGSCPLGSAFRRAESQSEKEKNGFSRRFQRLLACDTLEEVLMVLPHDLKLFLSKSIKLDYKRLLRDLVNFQYDDARDKVKVSWAKDYLGMEEE